MSNPIFQTARSKASIPNPSGQLIGTVDRIVLDFPDPDDGNEDFRYAQISVSGDAIRSDGTLPLDTDCTFTVSQVNPAPGLAFAWTLTAEPAGATETFSAAAAQTTNFQSDTAGLYTVQCEITSTDANPDDHQVSMQIRLSA